VTSGMLETLLEHGYRHAFVSNSDNLGATFDARILAWFAAQGLPFLSEVADRTEADKKGGHVARLRETGGLVLRETAQTADEDVAAFQDVERHPYFNCNTLWLDLRALSETLSARGNVLGLPMIVNRKTVDPGDKGSPEVFQLETAMGAAIGVFEGAGALRVPRTRFLPVKTTDDLFVLRSDAYALDDASRVVLAPAREGRAPLVSLDPEHFKLVRDFEAHLPSGPPSLVACDRLTVEGDVTFGADVVCRGEVVVRGPARIEDGTELEGGLSDADRTIQSVFVTEEEADAEAARRNRALRGSGSEYFYVAAFLRERRWAVERRGGPVPRRERFRHALRPWAWGWWPWNH